MKGTAEVFGGALFAFEERCKGEAEGPLLCIARSRVSLVHVMRERLAGSLEAASYWARRIGPISGIMPGEIVCAKFDLHGAAQWGSFWPLL